MGFCFIQKKVEKKSFLPLFKCKSGLIYGSSPGTQDFGGKAFRAVYAVLYPAHAGGAPEGIPFTTNFLGGYG